MTAPTEAGPEGLARRDYQEFLDEPFTTLVSSTDADGRPLCPEALVAIEVRETFELRPCRYGGSRERHPLPMNVSALRQVTRHWPEILAGAAFLRTRHAARTGRSAPSLVDVMTIAYTGGWLPSFLSHRASAPCGDGTVPGAVSALHKAIVDVGATAQVMVLEALRRGDGTGLDAPADGDALAAFAEERGFFIGTRGVCAGPPALVAELVRTMVGRAGAGPASGALPSLVGDARALFEYSESVLATFLGKMLVRGVSHYTFDRLAGRLSRDAPHVVGLIREAEAATVALRARHGDVTLLSRIDAAKRRVLLDARGPERVRLRQGLQDVLAALAPGPADPGQWVLASGDGAALRRFIAGGPDGGEDAVRDALADAFDESVRLEAGARRVFERLERRIRRALGDERPPRPLGRADFGRAFGVTPSDVIGPLLGVSVAFEPDRTVVVRGDDTFAVGSRGPS